MSVHPALAKDNVAVITGGASGIGLAAASAYAGMGMKVCIADRDSEKLAAASRQLAGICANGEADVLASNTDVADIGQVQLLKQAAVDRFGHIDVLMNNAGIGVPTGSWDNIEGWQLTLGVNLWGVINGVQTFTPIMLAQGTPGLIINTASKQGITCPPGNTAYNTSKAAVKALTEGLAHSLRNEENSQVSAHLLVPGFVYSGMISRWMPEKPDGAWTCEQTVEYMLERLNRGDFYIICPDNDVSQEMDRKRISWAAGDLIENRPALSRWHPDYAAAFEQHMNKNEE